MELFASDLVGLSDRVLLLVVKLLLAEQTVSAAGSALYGGCWRCD